MVLLEIIVTDITNKIINMKKNIDFGVKGRL